MISGPVKLRLQILVGAEPAIGPGKALVLEAIERTGSISAAGRDLGMSYRRTWLLVDSLNRTWREQVVETRIGGGKQGGAALTGFGRALLSAYRAVEHRMMTAAAGPELDWLLDARVHAEDR